jgi:hypothetical protein
LYPAGLPDDIYNAINEEIQKGRRESDNNGLDGAARMFNYIPGVLLKFCMGWSSSGLFQPAAAGPHKSQPLPRPMFITSMGSLGLQPIYHHPLTSEICRCLIALGIKRRIHPAEGRFCKREQGNGLYRRFGRAYLDGHYYATCFKYIKYLFNNPEQLDSRRKRF